MNIELVLGKTGMACRLLIDGIDVSSAIRGVEVMAHVGQLTEVRLTTVPSSVTIAGQAGRTLGICQQVTDGHACLRPTGTPLRRFCDDHRWLKNQEIARLPKRRRRTKAEMLRPAASEGC